MRSRTRCFECHLWIWMAKPWAPRNFSNQLPRPHFYIVSGNKAAQSGWAHYKVRWHQRAVKQCERRESEHILPLCVSRSLCSTKTDRAERLTRERETWQLRDLGAGERECAGVRREEREREREREVGKRLPPLSISRASCGKSLWAR